jgi:succinate-semialdehyde dehydrogenase / glutarate-semialdehyde dehydrogenase
MAQISEMVQLARAAQPGWEATPLRDRLRLLTRFRKRLVARVEDLEKAVAADLGKPRFDTITEVFHLGNLITWLEDHTARLLQPKRVGTFPLIHKAAEVRQMPLGVVLAITPFNYPVILSLCPVLQALAVGNTVISKPSEHLRQTIPVLEQCFAEAKPPQGLW